MSFDVTFVSVVTWLLAALFVAFGIANFIGPKGMREGYARWGYPPYWRFVTGTLEFGAGVLMFIPALSMWGLALAAFCCLAAFTTLVWHREYSHTPPSAVLLVVIAALVVL